MKKKLSKSTLPIGLLLISLNVPEMQYEVCNKVCYKMMRRCSWENQLIHGCYIQQEVLKNANASSRFCPGLRRSNGGWW
jgi:hypothetical protein